MVLSYGFWQRRFNANRGVLGRTLRLDNQSATIIGVMPPSFQFPDKTTELWMLLTADARWPLFQRFRIAVPSAHWDVSSPAYQSSKQGQR